MPEAGVDLAEPFLEWVEAIVIAKSMVSLCFAGSGRNDG